MQILWIEIHVFLLKSDIKRQSTKRVNPMYFLRKEATAYKPNSIINLGRVWTRDIIIITGALSATKLYALTLIHISTYTTHAHHFNYISNQTFLFIQSLLNVHSFTSQRLVYIIWNVCRPTKDLKQFHKTTQ